MRILVANRGEIARRIIRSAERLGYESVAVYADPDRDAPFVAEATHALRLGSAALADSYLSSDRLLEAAARSGATAVHPGYGFLSENAAFARAVAEAGLIWIGPHADAIARMGSKIEARALADAAGVPTIPGFDESQVPAELAKAAERIGFPVLVKAAAGGGGKGIRIVHSPGEFAAALEEASQEAERSFANADMIVERYVEKARHVEVQIVGDRHGAVVDLGTRECSVQRRYQKLLEEAPAPNLPEATRSGLRESARKLATAIGYDSAGTVEFVVDDETGDYFFLEMNTRLQVEHPVTEAITGLDLVELQFSCAAGEPLPLDQAEVDARFRGHAFEARINAEDADAEFAPQIGTIDALRVPAGVRWESGVEAGSEITPHYDSMLAKLIVHAHSREVARRRLAAALDELIIGGIVTNVGFHRWLIEQAPVAEGRVTTRFLEEHSPPLSEDEREAAELAALAWTAARRAARGARSENEARKGTTARSRASASATSTPSTHTERGPWFERENFRITPHRPSLPLAVRDRHGRVHEIRIGDSHASFDGERLTCQTNGVRAQHPASVDLAARRVSLNLRGKTHSFALLSRSEHWAPTSETGGHDSAEATSAPFPAVVTETPVAAGDRVVAGDVVVVIEAMKMLHSLTARGPAVVAEVCVQPGESVEARQVLVRYEAPETLDEPAPA